MVKLSCGFLIWTLAAFEAAAQIASPADKNDYNLFNPTPKELMRELSPDRPDKTESPYTVDAGHYQLEMDFANYTYDDTDGARTKAWQVGDFNLKAGLLNKVDFQLVYDNYLNVRTEDRSGKTATQSGFGDFTARLKVNLWGDDGGKTAFALLPYVKFPTSTDGLGNNAVEGGVIFPLAVKLPADFDLSLETAAGFFQDDNDNRYHEEFIASASLDHQLIGKLSGYVEFFSNFTTESHAGWVGTVDGGLEYLVTDNIQLDGGCNFGITRAADDFNPFAGITWRF
jgi:Putative MetA-pathway of phenol degradation